MCIQTLQEELAEAEADFEKAQMVISGSKQSMAKSKSDRIWGRYTECLRLIEQLRQDIRVVQDLEARS